MKLVWSIRCHKQSFFSTCALRVCNNTKINGRDHFQVTEKALGPRLPGHVLLEKPSYQLASFTKHFSFKICLWQRLIYETICCKPDFDCLNWLQFEIFCCFNNKEQKNFRESCLNQHNIFYFIWSNQDNVLLSVQLHYLRWLPIVLPLHVHWWQKLK